MEWKDIWNYNSFKTYIFYHETIILLLATYLFRHLSKYILLQWQRRMCTVYSYVTSVCLIFVSDNIINNSDNFRIKCLSYSKFKCNFMCSLVSVFTLFIQSWKTCQLMWKNFVFLVIFDTCDAVYNWSSALLPPILLDNLFVLRNVILSYI